MNSDVIDKNILGIGMLGIFIQCFAIDMARFLIAFVALFAYANAFCFNAPGGIGEYHKDCSSSIGMYLS